MNVVVQNFPILTDLSDGILRITLNDPNKRNALSEAMLDGLHASLDAAKEDRNVRVVILNAAGTVFSAGHNLQEMTAARDDSDGGREYFARIMRLCSAMMQKVVHLPKPVIAEVAGTATAAGCQLVASCDLAYAAPEAKFATPGVNIGLFCSTPMVALSRNVSNKRALEMLLTGEAISADTAAQFGLINEVVAAKDLASHVNAVAFKIAAKSMKTVKIGKEAFYNQKQMTLADAYDYCSDVMTENMMTSDANEGIRAFLEKRTPDWTDE